MTASPISDLNPILMAVGATVAISSKKGNTCMFDVEFIVSYNAISNVRTCYEILINPP